MNQIIKASMVDDVLIPDVNGIVEIDVEYQQDMNGMKTALISFGGCHRAAVTFAVDGQRIVNHFSLGFDDSVQMQKSVENIVNVL